jgi:hypothetical protein
MTSALATACRPAIVRRALVMAAVVGPILTLINQGDALVSDLPFSFWKAGLTFIVPYLVATVSAVARPSAPSSPITTGTGQTPRNLVRPTARR